MKSIRFKIQNALTGAIVVVALCAIAVLVINQISAFKNQKIIELMTQEHSVINLTDELILKYSDAVKSPDDLQVVTTYENAKFNLLTVLKTLMPKIVSGESKAIFLGLENTVKKVIEECDAGLKHMSEGGFSDISDHLIVANINNDFVKDNTRTLLQKELEYLAKTQENSKIVYTFSVATSVGIFMLIILGMIFYASSFSKQIITPLTQLSLFAKEVAFGDLNAGTKQELPITEDEVGSLTKSIYSMVDKLLESIEQEKVVNKRIEKTVEERTIQLMEQEARLSASINSFILGFVMVNLNNEVLNINSAALSILGIEPPVKNFEIIERVLKGSCDLNFLHEKCLKEKKLVDVKSIAFGSKFLHIMLSPILLNNDDKEEYIGTVVLIEDITEAKVVERSKDEFFSIASHELRTPLTAIRGNTSMVLDYYKEALKDPELKAMITDTHDASVRLIGIVNDFLDVSRLEQGKMQYAIADVEVVDVINKVVKDLAENAKSKGVKLVVVGDKKIQVKADPGKVEQIIFNIVGNSLKFTDKGSVTIKVVGKVSERMATIEVMDTGLGIPVANQNILFHKFQQAGSSLITRDGAKGTGLGLYISRLMAEGMGGKLELIKSEEGKGSVFGISLPLK